MSAAPAMACQIDLHHIFGVVIDGVFEFNRGVADFADTVVAVDEAGLGQRVTADGAGGDLLGRREVLLHQCRRNSEDIADVVEAVAGIVGGELFGGAEIDAQQVADGVGIFVAIEAMGHGAAGIGLLVLVGFREFGLDDADEGRHGFRRGAWDAGRRHFASLQFGEDFDPAVAIGRDRGGLEVGGNVQIAGIELGVMAVIADLNEDGLDIFLESWRGSFRSTGGGCVRRGYRSGSDQGSREDRHHDRLVNMPFAFSNFVRRSAITAGPARDHGSTMIYQYVRSVKPVPLPERPYKRVRVYHQGTLGWRAETSAPLVALFWSRVAWTHGSQRGGCFDPLTYLSIGEKAESRRGVPCVWLLRRPKREAWDGV